MEVQEPALKRKRSSIENPDPLAPQVPENDPMPFTCLCYKGECKTTDDSGLFIHRDAVTKKVQLIRCEMTPAQDVVFTFLRHLEESELLGFDKIDEVNAVKNIMHM